MLEACGIAARQSRDAVLVNVSTYGVSCEFERNFGIIVRYLSGDINYLSLMDTNHNVKNARYQIIGASSADVLGENVFDPWLLRLAKIVQQLWRIEEYASDAIVLHLASAKSVRQLVRLEKPRNDSSRNSKPLSRGLTREILQSRLFLSSSRGSAHMLSMLETLTGDRRQCFVGPHFCGSALSILRRSQ